MTEKDKKQQKLLIDFTFPFWANTGKYECGNFARQLSIDNLGEQEENIEIWEGYFFEPLQDQQVSPGDYFPTLDDKAFSYNSIAGNTSPKRPMIFNQEEQNKLEKEIDEYHQTFENIISLWKLGEFESSEAREKALDLARDYDEKFSDNPKYLKTYSAAVRYFLGD